MYKKLALLIIFIPEALICTGLSTQYFLQLLYKDCSALHDNLQSLPFSDLQQRLTIAQKKEYDHARNIQIAGFLGGMCTWHVLYNTEILSNFYPEIILGTTIVAGYLYIRDNAISSARTAIEQELANRRATQIIAAQDQQRRNRRQHCPGEMLEQVVRSA